MIGLCSDIHDNIWALDRALPHLEPASTVLFLGDFCAPFTLAQLAEGVAPRPLHVIWGNNDGDRHLLTQIASGFDHVHLHGEFLDLEIEGLHVVASHYPDVGRRLAAGGADVVCYGHDHKTHEERVGDCLLVNPGEIMGRFGRRTVALLDPADRRLAVVAFE